MKRTVFVQSELLDDIKVVETEHHLSPAELRKLLFAILPPFEHPVFVFIENHDDECGFNDLKEVPEGLRVHVHRHRTVDVTVRYAGRTVHKAFAPSTTIEAVKRHATRELGMTPSDAAELMLQVAGTDLRPDPDVHIGTLAKGHECKVTLDLVPSPRINGQQGPQ